VRGKRSSPPFLSAPFIGEVGGEVFIIFLVEFVFRKEYIGATTNGP
jgi:hypothetical protein